MCKEIFKKWDYLKTNGLLQSYLFQHNAQTPEHKWKSTCHKLSLSDWASGPHISFSLLHFFLGFSSWIETAVCLCVWIVQLLPAFALQIKAGTTHIVLSIYSIHMVENKFRICKGSKENEKLSKCLAWHYMFINTWIVLFFQKLAQEHANIWSSMRDCGECGKMIFSLTWKSRL